MANYYDFNKDFNTKQEQINYEHCESPKNTGNKNSSGKGSHKLVKRIGTLTLSAVLFGSVAAASFQTVSRVYNSNLPSQAPVQAASETENTDTKLLKTTSVSDSSTNTGSLDVSDIAEAVMPSIVSITNKSVQEVENYFSQFGYYGIPETQETESCGSGIIIGKNDTELLIVTNNHVVEGADTLSACFIDNEAYEAQIKGTDASNDLAVIAVPLDSISEDTLSGISVATVGDSDSLKVGQQVIAIGNALGYGQSVTTGIVSAVNRSISEDGDSIDGGDSSTYIQTDAAINPGNSGGALLNMNGEVVGINSAKLALTEVEGMGYAIPTSRASSIIEGLMNQTTRTTVSAEEQGYMGIQGVNVTEEIQQAYGLPVGVYISEVTSGSAADQAGIASGNILTGFDGQSISDINQLQELLSKYKAGETVDVTLQVQVENAYEEQTLSLTLGAKTVEEVH